MSSASDRRLARMGGRMAFICGLVGAVGSAASLIVIGDDGHNSTSLVLSVVGMIIGGVLIVITRPR
ncbi:hypothetical protein GWI34_32395 [Actinomadura sp. DSM 109109]|nr:hypothetical protein [Actinomadura lepetitiana]